MADKGTILLLERGEALEAAVLREGRKDPLGCEVLDVPVPEDDSSAAAEVAAAFQGPIHLVLPAARVLLRAAVLPTDDLSEVQGMVELQVDQWAPYPIEQCVVSFEVLARESDGFRVLMAAVPRKDVVPWEESVAGAAARIERVDIDLFGWWRLLQEADRVVEEDALLVLLDGSQAVVLLLENGLPVHVSSYSRDPAEPLGAFFEDVGEDLGFVLTALESERPGFAPVAVRVWHLGGTPSGTAALATLVDGPVTTHSLAECPPLLEALSARAAEFESEDAPEGRVNLVPPDWVAARDEVAFRNRLVTVLVGVVAAWLVVVGAAVAVFSHTDRQVQSWQSRSTGFEASVDMVGEVERRIDALRQFSDRTYSSLECLREITVLMPEGVRLSTLTYNKSREVNITGEAPTQSLAFEYAGNIGASAMFVESSPDYVKDQPRGNGYTFKIQAELPGLDEVDEGGGG